MRFKIVCILFFFININLLSQEQECHILTSDSVELYVSVKGNGIPCLYIHGGPGSGSFWLEKYFGYFLEQHFQMVYLDQRGVGRSGSPVDHNYSMNRMVKDFEEVRIALNIEHWITMGHSFGGILQMGYSVKYPDIILGMIMINCTLNMTESFSGSWIPKASEFLGFPVSNIYTNESISLLDRLMGIIGKLNERNLNWKMAFTNEDNYKLIHSTYKEIPDWNYDLENQGLSRKEYWDDYKSFTLGFTKPVLFFTGNQDWMAGPNNYYGVNFPEMLLYKSNVGHLPFIENKPDLENAIILYLEKYNFR